MEYPKKSTLPPTLAAQEQHFACGYAPRDLHLSYGTLGDTSTRAFFVGCKDGSVVAIARDNKGTYKRYSVSPPGSQAVRALSEWSNGRSLMVGRQGGGVELIEITSEGGALSFSKPYRLSTGGGPNETLSRPHNSPSQEAVRSLGQIDAERRFISYRHAGTIVLEKSIRRQQEGQTCAAAQLGTLLHRDQQVRDALFILPLYRHSGCEYVIVNHRGEVFTWNGMLNGGFGALQLVENVWANGEEPGLVNDVAVVRGDQARSKHQPAQAILLATDRGVYLLFFRSHQAAPELYCKRLSLPGLGSVCMALGYSEWQDAPQYCYLWATDSRGDGYLYWSDRCQNPEELNFRPSGISALGSQAMLAVAYSTGERLVVAETLRNDQVAVREYAEVNSKQRTWRWLLDQGTQEDLLDRRELKVDDGAPPYARLAELFEYLAERGVPRDSRSRHQSDDWFSTLLDFLSDPSPELALDILRKANQPLGSGADTSSPAAVRLWTLSLLGILNRPPVELGAAQRETALLGVIRWLRKLRQEVDAEVQPAHERLALPMELDACIQMVRKWGLFGEANSLRKHLAQALRVLGEENLPDPEKDSRNTSKPDERRLDRLTYQTLLFERGIDVVMEERCGHLSGRHAWDVSIRSDVEAETCAVSWGWGGVEVYKLKRVGTTSPELDLQLIFRAEKNAEGIYSSSCTTIGPGEQTPFADSPNIASLQAHRAGHSRAILLGKTSEDKGSVNYLITAPAPERGESSYIELWTLQYSEDRFLAGKYPARHELPAQQSVYSLLDLGDGKFVAGLGNNSVQFFQVTKERSRLNLLNGPRRELRGGKGQDGRSNQVWSLTSTSDIQNARNAGPIRQLIAGLEDGSIWLVSGLENVYSSDTETSIRYIGQIGSPVKALCCRFLDQPTAGLLRVCAGGSDGSVVAWQEVPRKNGEGGSEVTWQGVQEKDSERSTVFAPLWACHEGSEIVGLYSLTLLDAQRERSPMILAVTNEERCVFYDDRDVTNVPPKEQLPRHRPWRIPFAGCRHGTFERSRMESFSAFASAFIRGSEQEREDGRAAEVLTGSRHGVVRLLSLHYPHFLVERKDRYQQIIKTWWHAVEQASQLRLVHAIYRASPSLELILVRWLLGPRESVNSPLEDESPKKWMLPRSLRDLLRLRDAWEAYNVDDVKRLIEELLRQAFTRGDLALFREICEALLKKGNASLFEASDLSENSAKDLRQRKLRLYLAVHNSVERSLSLWRGSPHRSESLARATVARFMVDGDTFWSLMRGVSNELPELKPAEPDSFIGVYRRRFQGVRELVFKRDSTVSLEALRAANLSLLRLAKRLVDARRDRYSPELGKRPLPDGELPRDVPWEMFEEYFETLCDAAAQAFGAKLELNVALAIGYARTFALCVCICPTATMRMANRLTERSLILNQESGEDLGQRIQLQFRVLAQVGVVTPIWAQELFRIGTTPDKSHLSPFDDVFLRRELAITAHPREEKEISNVYDRAAQLFGEHNAVDLVCLSRTFGCVCWCLDLERILLGDINKLSDIWQGRTPLKTIRTPDTVAHYRYSYRFWRKAFLDLNGVLKRAHVWKTSAPPSTGPPGEESATTGGGGEGRGRARSYSAPRTGLQPRLILLSQQIEEWAKESLGDLHRRFQAGAIFQPEFPSFAEALDRIRRAANSFPESAAVSMEIVSGVLGHHLIEDLDEHILELHEIAHVLDPLMVREYRQKGEMASIGDRTLDALPEAQKFARYLIERSHRAESIPDQLRRLLTMLTQDRDLELHQVSIKDVLMEFKALGATQKSLGNCSDLSRPLADRREADYLRLVLRELAENWVKHTHASRRLPPETTATVASDDPRAPRIEIGVRLRWKPKNDELDEYLDYFPDRTGGTQTRLTTQHYVTLRHNFSRLCLLQGLDLQRPIKPKPERTVPSSGMGLYVANFAAAVVGWKLTIGEVELEKIDGREVATCLFLLSKPPKSGQQEAPP